jgi:hypothetical protein
MPRYDRQYDYGLRGYRETTERLPPRGFAGRIPAPDEPLPNRVTARYNADYVYGDRGPRYPRNFNTFGGDRERRVGDFRYFRQPYSTRGGTRTFRGAAEPIGYDAGMTDRMGGYDYGY